MLLYTLYVCSINDKYNNDFVIDIDTWSYNCVHAKVKALSSWVISWVA